MICHVLSICISGLIQQVASSAMALTPVQFAASSFDYLIAGGGTAGLTLAARLSENPKVQVGVLEAGEDHTTDPLVLNTAFTAALWDNPIYDWMFKTTPQVSPDISYFAYVACGSALGFRLTLSP